MPAFFPRLEALVYSPRPATSTVVAIGAQYQLLITIGTWLQATGATLCVVFFLGLVTLAGARGSLAAQVVLLGSAVLVALVLLEGIFTLTWVTAAAGGTPTSARAGYDLMSRFIQVFPLVPRRRSTYPWGGSSSAVRYCQAGSGESLSASAPRLFSLASPRCTFLSLKRSPLDSPPFKTCGSSPPLASY